MSSSTNRKSIAQKRILYCHYELRAPVCNVNTPKNKRRKFFRCTNFKEELVDDTDAFDATILEGAGGVGATGAAGVVLCKFNMLGALKLANNCIKILSHQNTYNR
ncbi:hypothetical protein Gohar_020730 [Gossypium harknessii]|uniref:Uncharacterized protein n=1 Tax=Gossypium harknessii TaxID=34285 RepID=A0A7J9I1B8_9ROSI|nr:hypothetical protein [Gossypium harknessii]